MKLTIDGELRLLIPIKQFREQQGLPDDFGIELFAPKIYTGLGSIDNLGPEWEQLQAALLQFLPMQPPTQGWLSLSLTLQAAFHRLLAKLNDRVGLRPSEITYAAAGVGDFCQEVIYSTMAAQVRGEAPPPFSHLHQRWLDHATAVSRTVYWYHHDSAAWQVRLIVSAYGRCGLAIMTDRSTYYVGDARYACPAAGYLVPLFEALTTRIQALMTTATKSQMATVLKDEAGTTGQQTAR